MLPLDLIYMIIELYVCLASPGDDVERTLSAPAIGMGSTLEVGAA
jgi:hypothetical protein